MRTKLRGKKRCRQLSKYVPPDTFVRTLLNLFMALFLIQHSGREASKRKLFLGVNLTFV